MGAPLLASVTVPLIVQSGTVGASGRPAKLSRSLSVVVWLMAMRADATAGVWLVVEMRTLNAAAGRSSRYRPQSSVTVYAPTSGPSIASTRANGKGPVDGVLKSLDLKKLIVPVSVPLPGVASPAGVGVGTVGVLLPQFKNTNIEMSIK